MVTTNKGEQTMDEQTKKYVELLNELLNLDSKMDLLTDETYSNLEQLWIDLKDSQTKENKQWLTK
jgi:hemerythrin